MNHAAPSLEGDLGLLYGLGLVPLVGAVACIACDLFGRRRAALFAMTATAAIFITGALGGVALRVDRHQISPALAATIDRQSDGAPRVAQYGFFRPSLVYYTGGRLESCGSPSDIGNYLSATDDSFVVLPAEDYRLLMSQLPADVVVIDRLASFPKQGEVLLLARRVRQARALRSPLPSTSASGER